MNNLTKPLFIIKWTAGPYAGRYWCKEISYGVLKDRATRLTNQQLEPIKNTFRLPIVVESA